MRRYHLDLGHDDGRREGMPEVQAALRAGADQRLGARVCEASRR